MYHLFNTDDLSVLKVPKQKLSSTLQELEAKGAVLTLDIDDEICYSFEDDYEGEPIEDLILKATHHE